MKKDKKKTSSNRKGFKETQSPFVGEVGSTPSLKKGKMSALLETALEAVEAMERDKKH